MILTDVWGLYKADKQIQFIENNGIVYPSVLAWLFLHFLFGNVCIALGSWIHPFLLHFPKTQKVLLLFYPLR